MRLVPGTRAWYKRKLDNTKKASKKKLERVRNSLKAIIQDLEQERKRLVETTVPKEDYELLEKHLSDTRAELSLKEGLYQQLEGKYRILKARHEELVRNQQEYNRLEESIGDMETRIQTLISRNSGLEEELSTIRIDYKRLESEKEALENDIKIRDRETERILRGFKSHLVGNQYRLRTLRGVKADMIVIYHIDLDGIASAALAIQPEIRGGKKVKAIGKSGDEWLYVLDHITRTDRLFILDLPLLSKAVPKLSSLSCDIVFITDKPPEVLVPTNVKMICDENRSTSELVYDFLDKSGNIGYRRKSQRIAELGMMSHGRKADREAQNIMYGLDIEPQLSGRIVYELAEYGVVRDERLWRRLEEMANISLMFEEMAYERLKKVYEDGGLLMLELPDWSISPGKVLGRLRSESGKSTLGIEYKKDTIHLQARVAKEGRDLYPLFSHIRDSFEGEGIYHGAAGSVEFPKKYVEDVTGFVRDFYSKD